MNNDLILFDRFYIFQPTYILLSWPPADVIGDVVPNDIDRLFEGQIFELAIFQTFNPESREPSHCHISNLNPVFEWLKTGYYFHCPPLFCLRKLGGWSHNT